MRITTWNVNGLRAALRKGFADHLAEIAPDVLLLQEVRAFPQQLPDDWATPEGWHVTWHPAEKPGYAGTAVWTRQPHKVLGRGLDGPSSGPPTPPPTPKAASSGSRSRASASPASICPRAPPPTSASKPKTPG